MGSALFFWGQKHQELWPWNCTVTLRPWFQNSTLSVTISQAFTARIAQFSTESVMHSTDKVHITSALLSTAKRALQGWAVPTICAPAHPPATQNNCMDTVLSLLAAVRIVIVTKVCSLTWHSSRGSGQCLINAFFGEMGVPFHGGIPPLENSTWN